MAENVEKLGLWSPRGRRSLYASEERHRTDRWQVREGRKGPETFDDWTGDAGSSKLKGERVVLM